MHSCFVCDLPSVRFLFSKSGRCFHRCNKCGIVVQHPFPDPGAIRQLYENSYKSGMYADFAAAANLKLATAQRRFREIEQSIRIEGKWLDVGCSTGVFVKTGLDRGLDIQGIDISREAVQIGTNTGLPLKCGDISSIREGPTFDCITAFDVVEHLDDPGAFVRTARGLLNPGGHLIVTTPNLNSFARYVMGRRWFFFIPDEHLCLFTPNSLHQLFASEDFEIVNSGRTYKPMTFDYALLQFKEFNPLVARLMTSTKWLIPRKFRSMNLLLPIGEQRLIATPRSCNG